jgi:hypothetical protein
MSSEPDPLLAAAANSEKYYTMAGYDDDGNPPSCLSLTERESLGPVDWSALSAPIREKLVAEVQAVAKFVHPVGKEEPTLFEKLQEYHPYWAAIKKLMARTSGMDPLPSWPVEEVSF